MNRVTSRDGTPIAFDRTGRGPAVILVNGGLADRSENAPLAAELAERFTVYNYDRRGRGGSGDTPPYYQPPISLLSKITRPTLAITGDVLDTHMTGLPSDLFERAAEAITQNVSDAQRHRLPGQTHMVEASALALVLAHFFTDPSCQG